MHKILVIVIVFIIVIIILIVSINRFIINIKKLIVILSVVFQNLSNINNRFIANNNIRFGFSENIESGRVLASD